MKTLGFLAILLFGLQAWSSVEVTCFNGGCLNEGYDIVNHYNGQCAQVVCKGDSCEADGWVEFDHWGRARVEVECKNGGCFRVGFNGYQARERFRGPKVFEATCYGDINVDELDCLKYGWEIEGINLSQEVECRQSNCRQKGWVLHDYTGRYRGPSRVKCKSGGCFTTGWHHY